MTLGEKLTRLRKSRGFSQEELAARLTVSRQAVSRWEAGETLPDAENLLHLSDLFGVTTDYLLREEQEESAAHPTPPEHSAPSEEEKADNRRISFAVLFCATALPTLLLLLSWGLQLSVGMALGFVGQGAVVLGAELGFWRYRAQGDPGVWRRKYYRGAVWMLAVYPSFVLNNLLFQLPPLSTLPLYAPLWYYAPWAAGYLLLCCAVRWLLREKREEK